MADRNSFSDSVSKEISICVRRSAAIINQSLQITISYPRFKLAFVTKILFAGVSIIPEQVSSAVSTLSLNFLHKLKKKKTKISLPQ